MDAKLRAWWSQRQGLDGSLAGKTAQEVLAQTGWARSVAGASPYLALFARAGLRRADVDAELAKAKIQELPAARGCTYIVPAEHYALALTAGQNFSAKTELATARKLGVTDAELASLKAAVLKALEKDSLDPDALRTAVGSAARSLGPEGVKKGLATTLPLALGVLQAEGDIRRVPVNGRIDQQRYRYTLWKPNPLAKWKLDTDASFTELARHYFGWVGAASLAQFQRFSGLGVKATQAATAPLKLVPFPGDLLALADDAASFTKFQIPKKPQYVLTGSLDSILHLGDMAGDSDREGHAILDRGQLIGRWHFDTGTNTIAWAASIKRDKALEEAVAKTEAFVQEDLGDARTFSLDSPKSRAPRIAALREAAAG